MRVSRRLVGTMVGLAVILLASPAPAQTQPTLRIDPTEGPPGTTIEMEGEGWPASPDEITITWGFLEEPMSPVPTIEDGVLSGAAVIPSDALGGVWPVEVCAYEPGSDDVPDPSDTVCVTARFSVIPAVTVSPGTGIAGTEILLEGSGFEGGSSFSWDVLWSDRRSIGTALQDENGRVEGSGAIPFDAVEGQTAIQVCRDGVDGEVCHDVFPPFEVLSPTASIDPIELRPQDSAVVSGEGWCCEGAAGTVVDTGSDIEWGTVVVTATGTLTGAAIVPDDTQPGEKEIAVCVADQCRSVPITVLSANQSTTSTTTTTIGPSNGSCAIQGDSLTVEPSSGQPETPVTVSLVGAADSPPGCQASLTLAGRSLGRSIPIIPGETSSIDAVVPDGIGAGTADLVATDPATNEILATVSFTIDGDEPFPWETLIWVAIVVVGAALAMVLWRILRRSGPTPVPEPIGETITQMPSVPIRWIEARLFARDGGIDTPVEYFRPGATHRIEVRLGQTDMGEIEVLPREMRLVLTEPALFDAPQSATVTLSDAGPSTAANFMMTTEAATASVTARLLLVNGTRVVQTALLPATVGDAPPAIAANVARIETVVGAATAPVGRALGAALVVEGGGTPTLTHVSPSYPAAQIVMPESGTEAIDRIRFRLGEIVESPEDFAGLDKEDTRRLLIFLANHGRLLRSALVGDFLGEELAVAPTLQVVSAEPDAYLPLELAYDFIAPVDTAVVCPHAGDTLRSSDPLRTCPGNHDESVVCPTGFWGLSKVIERHTYQPGQNLRPGFLVRAQPLGNRDRIPLQSGAVVGASNRVDAYRPDTVGHLVKTLEAATDRATIAASWSAWDKEVAGQRPALLVLLPHTVYSTELDVPGLEIGASDRRWVSRIDEHMVPTTPVVAVLLGCETAVAGKVSYERFPGNLRRAGAEIVIATLTGVLGRHAAPLAERFVTLLEERCRTQPGRVGEVVLQLRRQLLSEGIPTVLGLAVYGDADWLVGGQ